ncbi:MAG: YerC/YecD family TrpR-related protein [Bacillota bacterium]
MAKNIKNEMTEQFFKAVMQLEDLEEYYAFFQDVATVGEIQAMAQRLEVARMLKKGITYEDIVEKTGVSTATISRVKRSLEYGEDGYELVLKRLEQ